MTSDTARAQQTEVREFLLNPRTHGLGSGEVGHIVTHISELFLAGGVVYKMKRAVRYSFVDFSDLESRRAACEAEVVLNRRTAPSLYVGIAAVRRASDGQLLLDCPECESVGEPIEWTVVMKRFNEDLTFDRIAERGGLRSRWILELVDAVITLHDMAEVKGAPFGGAEGLARILDENETDMAALPKVFPPAEIGVLIATARAALSEHGACLNSRREAGLVRRCHGDLHLGNVVLWRDRPTLFDCIEFSDQISMIDVFYDFAFLVMDLEVRGYRDYANMALSRFIGRQGNAGALGVLPLMLSLRAMVRAKVSAMAIGRKEGRQMEDMRAAAAKYIRAAKDFLAPQPLPLLCAIGGFSGSGKTTIARSLAPLLGRAPGALHLRSDYIRKRLARVAPEQRLPADAYTKAANRKVYEALMSDAASALQAGQCVVADAVFARPEERDMIESVANLAGVSFHGIWLYSSPETLIERVGDRQDDASDATAEVVRRQAKKGTGEINWTQFNNDAGPEAILGDLRKLLSDH